jgi:hypothetical protein
MSKQPDTFSEWVEQAFESCVETEKVIYASGVAPKDLKRALNGAHTYLLEARTICARMEREVGEPIKARAVNDAGA